MVHEVFGVTPKTTRETRVLHEEISRTACVIG